MGLKDDGTLVTVGDNDYKQCDVSGSTGIIQVAASLGYKVELRSDGTAVVV